MANALPALGALKAPAALPGAGLPAALPAPGPSSGAEFLQALGGLPQALQTMQLQQAQSQDQLRDLATKRLQQLASIGLSQPGVATNPAYVRQVQQIYSQLGVPVPRDTQGGIDVQAMIPKRTWAEIPDDERLKGIGLPPDARKAMFSDVEGVPQDYLAAPMSTAMNPAAMEGAQRTAASAASQLALGKITPGQFAGIIKANSNVLGDSAQYYLSDAFLNDTLSQAGAANIAKIQSLGLHLKNEDTLRQTWLSNQKDEFYAGLGEKRTMDTARIQQMHAMDQFRATQLAQAAARIEQGDQRLQIEMQNANTMVTRAQIARFSATLNPVLRDYESTQRLYTQTNSQIQQALNAGVTPDQSLIDTQLRLKDSLDSMSGTISQARAILNISPAAAAGVVTGMPVHAVSRGHLNVNELPPGTLYSPSRRQYKTPDGHVYDAQGNPVQ